MLSIVYRQGSLVKLRLRIGSAADLRGKFTENADALFELFIRRGRIVNAEALARLVLVGEESVARYDADLAQHGLFAEGGHIHAVRQGAPQEKAALDRQICYAVGNEMFVKELHGES